MPEFKGWPKIPRLNKNAVVITEKIDGTNACVIVKDNKVVGAQSRNRMLSLEEDNFEFAHWVDQNKELLSALGDGYHFGEWAGPGIQKNPHALDKKTFFLFNSLRYKNNPDCPALKICSVVPILSEEQYTWEGAMHQMELLKCGATGVGAGRDTKPEGIVVYFHSFRASMKYTFEHSEGKWKS